MADALNNVVLVLVRFGLDYAQLRVGSAGLDGKIQQPNIFKSIVDGSLIQGDLWIVLTTYFDIDQCFNRA